MGNGWHEWPLMVFTVFGQCVVGGFIVLALALMTGKLSVSRSSAWWAACSDCGY
ncbi:anaerobic dimethyl sulfoxide reductase subunit C [Klebsiella pneumoniae]|uniref:Anaerobic dimethyl sulfoxide reductase subunit C n=1 Tax=Klebsiella pneumoniae TaxID=573 RepID=A0A377TSJ3_KLEPN|nr:anaerobic dimethyl sulfoxide reductase subunit C [Klebsiella pneumoniae]